MIWIFYSLSKTWYAVLCTFAPFSFVTYTNMKSQCEVQYLYTHTDTDAVHCLSAEKSSLCPSLWLAIMISFLGRVEFAQRGKTEKNSVCLAGRSRPCVPSP